MAITNKSSDYKRVPITSLRVGTTLKEPIFEADSMPGKDLLLLAAGHQLTQNVVDQLVKRGISEVRVSVRELERMYKAPGSLAERNPAAAAAVKRASQEELRDAAEKFSISPQSHLHQVKQHGALTYPPERIAKVLDSYQKTTDQVDVLLDGLCQGNMPSSAQMAGASEESLNLIADDIDLVVALGLNPADELYSSQHSLQTAMLAMSVGTTLGLKRDQLVELGIGCLVHDAGMRFIPQELVHADRKLTEIEFLEITKHPIITFDLLKDTFDVPTGSRMVAYQMHERLNGTGYPRQRHGTQIHPLARIAMVADTFVAMVSPRPYRVGMLPYKVMQYMLLAVKHGLFDADVVRGLLQTTSLFPIGSYVELNDGRRARVVRAHRELFNKPVVEIDLPEGADGEPELIDTAAGSDFEIVRALPMPPRRIKDASFATAG